MGKEREIDGWIIIRLFLEPFRVETSDEAALQMNMKDLESSRVIYANKLMTYVIAKGYRIISNTDPDQRGRLAFTIDYPIQNKLIKIPIHIVTPNPNENIQDRALSLRLDIPLLHFLSGMGHETTHLDRYFSDPVIADRMERMVSEDYKNHHDWAAGVVSEFVQEEIDTDVQNFVLLNHLGIPVMPENFCSYVGRGQLYQAKVYERITQLK